MPIDSCQTKLDHQREWNQRKTDMNPQAVWIIVTTVICAAVGLSIGISAWLLMPDQQVRQEPRQDT